MKMKPENNKQTFASFISSGMSEAVLEAFPLSKPSNSKNQENAISYIIERALSGKSSLLGLGTGEGKAYIALMTFDILRRSGVCTKKMLFCVPNSNSLTNIKTEVSKFTDFKAHILVSTDGMSPFLDSSVDIIIASYATLSQSTNLLKPDTSQHTKKRTVNPNTELVRDSIDYIVLDEVHNCDGHQSIKFSVMDSLVNGGEERIPVLAMSGTIAVSPDKLIDLWATMKLVDGGCSLGKTFLEYSEASGLFRKTETVLKSSRYNKYQPTIVKFVPYKDTKAKIEDSISDCYVFYEPHADKTSASIDKVMIEMHPKLRIIYDSILKEYRDQSNHKKAKTMLQQKLYQLGAGIFYDKDESDENYNAVPYELCTKAIFLEENLKNIIDKSEAKILIYYEHVACEILLQTACKRAGIKLISITAEQSTQQKKELRDIFVENDEYKVLCTPYRLGAESLNFVKSDMLVVNGVICFEVTLMKELFYQAIGRVDRINQKHKTWCKVLVTSDIESKWFGEVVKHRNYKLKG